MPSLLQPVLQASTGVGTIALVNGTPTILSYTTPNDGNYRTVIVGVTKTVSSDETGGAVDLVIGGTTIILVAAAKTAAGTPYVGGSVQLVPPNTLVKITQTALTGGASACGAQIWSPV